MLSGAGRDRLVESPNEVVLEFMGNLHILFADSGLGAYRLLWTLLVNSDLMRYRTLPAIRTLSIRNSSANSHPIRQFGSPAFHKQAV